MRPLILERSYSPDGYGTFGRIALGEVVIFTVERPWLDNAPFISCIPEGEYHCGPRRFFRGGYDAIEVKNVPGRSHILFHKANRPTDVAGCIAPVSWLGCLNGQWAGLNSAAAFIRLMEWFDGEPFWLVIRRMEP